MTLSPAFLFLICPLPVFSQGVHVGVKAGIPMTQYFETGAAGGLHGGATYSAATRRYTIGISGEWQFTHSFGFEADAMYHRMGYVARIQIAQPAS